MFVFSGQAQLIYASGLEVALENVQLREFEVSPGGLRQWAGSASAKPPVDLDNAQIELPDGSKGDVLVNNVQFDSNMPSTVVVSILGSGAPPSHRA